MDFTSLMGDVCSCLDINFSKIKLREEFCRRLKFIENSIVEKTGKKRDLDDAKKKRSVQKGDYTIEAIIDTALIESDEHLRADLTDYDNIDLPENSFVNFADKEEQIIETLSDKKSAYVDLCDLINKKAAEAKENGTLTYDFTKEHISPLSSRQAEIWKEFLEAERDLKNLTTEIKSYIQILKAEIEKIPSINDHDNKFIDTLFDSLNHFEAPTSVDYMRRLVLRRLKEISPEFVCEKGDESNTTDKEGYIIEGDERILKKDLPSTRVLILKQFIKQFKNIGEVSDRDFDIDKLLKKLEKIARKKKELFDYNNIDESVFASVDAMTDEFIVDFVWVHSRICRFSECTVLTSEIVELLSQAIKHEYLTQDDSLCGAMLCESFNLPMEEIENFKREYFSAELLLNHNYALLHKLRLALEKAEINEDFVDDVKKKNKAFSNCINLSRSKRGKNMAYYDKIYFVNQNSDAIDFNILYFISDLANAIFSMQGKTREFLYVFAIAFEMSFSARIRPNLTESDKDYETDIRKNLFIDYYCENLLNQLIKVDQNRSFEKNIDGYGPNLRNFVEMIYIKVICDENLNACEKLQKAKNLIYDCCNSKKAKTFEDLYEKEESYYSKLTSFLRKTFLESIIDMEYDKFKEFILDNYECKTVGKQSAVQLTNISTVGHQTARVYFSKLIEITNKATISKVDRFDKIKSEDDKNTECAKIIKKYNELFTQMSSYKTSLKSQKKQGYIKSEKVDATRINILFLLGDVVVTKFAELPNDEKSQIIVDYITFYNYIRNAIKIEINSKYKTKMLGLNSILLNCGFQEISSKNVFDLMLIYTLFKKCTYLNIEEEVNEV